MYELLKAIVTDLPKSPWAVITLLIIAILIAIVWKYISSFVTQKGKIQAEQRSSSNAEKSATNHLRSQQFLGHRFEFSDGVVAYARLRVSYEIVEPMLFFKSYKSNDEAIKKTAPLAYSKACYLLEKYPYAEAKRHREDAEVKLKNELSPEFSKWGIRLDHINIGHFERMTHET